MRKWGIDMKKNKNLVRVSIVASLLITTSSILGQNVEVMASNPTNYKDMMEYAAYENVIADAGASSGDFGISLALYDIDQDGIRELLISHGTCLADWVNDIYTLEDGKYVSYIGNVGRQGLFYTAPDGNGMYFLYGYQGYQKITRITKSGKDIVQTLIESRELNANENYTEFADKIALLAPGDIPTHGNSYDVEVTAPDGGVNMRCGAGVEYDKVLPDMIPNGTVLTVTQEAVASNGNSWGYTNYNGTYGWIALTQVTRYQEPTEADHDDSFSLFCQFCHQCIDLLFRAHINSAGRFVKNQDGRARRERDDQLGDGGIVCKSQSI